MQRAREISKSMISYLKRAREHKEFLLKETKEFERGKRHLANMMGIEPEEMTQKDIDEAIRYLFPSGMFDKRAWPMMRHPETIFKAQKEAQFDVEGRPHHHLFYTALPNYYESLSRLRDQIRELNDHEDAQLSRGILDPPDNSQYSMTGREWLSYEQLCDKCLEKVKPEDHLILCNALTHLRMHPYSSLAKEFLDEFSKKLPGQSSGVDLPEIKRDETTGQIYTIREVFKNQNWLQVKTVLNGTGKIDIDGKDILFFPSPYYRRAILFPLQISRMQDRVDIEAKYIRLGPQNHKGQATTATCIRYAVATSIAAYVDPELRERMRLAGLLTVDLRSRERKKFGQKAARAKYTWKKR